MASTHRTVRSSLSTAAKDKLRACLNWRIALSRDSDPHYRAAPVYYDAAWEWYRSLSLSQQDSVCTILAAWSMRDRRRVAEKWLQSSRPRLNAAVVGLIITGARLTVLAALDIAERRSRITSAARSLLPTAA